MPLPLMSLNAIPVSTGQPLTAWVPAKIARLVNFILYNDEDPGSSSKAAHMILEAAAEVDDNGNAVKSEIIDPASDVTVGPGAQVTYTLRNCPYYFVRLSARGDAPSFPSTLVRGSVEVIG